MILLTPEQMREVDRCAIEDGFPDLLLMETAGRGTADVLSSTFGMDAEKILIFAGKGNNGGDGLVAARYLYNRGYEVKVVLLSPVDELEGSPLKNAVICELKGIDLKVFNQDCDLDNIEVYLERCDIVVDALLGTGISGEVREPAAAFIDLINNSGRPVLAVDIPSGINGENAKVLGKAVRADLTVTMAYAKIGLALYPGREYCGEVSIIDLGVPETYAHRVEPDCFVLNSEEAEILLPERPAAAHKGSFGCAAVIGGSRGMSGAPSLTGRAALKSGAGLVKVVVPEEIETLAAGAAEEIITVPFCFDNEKEFKVINTIIEEADVIAAGPGMGRSAQALELINKLLNEYKGTLILDADGLNVVNDTEIFKKRKDPLIITPHPGEMARLIDSEVSAVQENRVKTALEFAVEKEIIVILKGADTITALPDGQVYINTTGNSGMATAGSGDVLAGITAGLKAQGLDDCAAAVLAPYLHGLSGDLACEEVSSYSLTAGDLISYLPKAFFELSPAVKRDKREEEGHHG